MSIIKCYKDVKKRIFSSREYFKFQTHFFSDTITKENQFKKVEISKFSIQHRKITNKSSLNMHRKILCGMIEMNFILNISIKNKMKNKLYYNTFTED